MKLNELFAELEQVAPLALSREYCEKFGAYDNSGVLIDCGGEITGALFTLDLSAEAVERATELGYNLIVTHHPAIYTGLKNIDFRAPLNRAICECIKRGISVVSMHLNYDAAPFGIDYYLMRGLGGEEGKTMHNLSCGAYGRVFNIHPTAFSDYVAAVGNTFSTRRKICYGEDRTVRRVASFCGAGCDEQSLAFAVENGADVFVSSDLKHNRIAELVARKICVLQLTHYSAENFGFQKIYSKLSASLSVPSHYYTDESLM